MKILFLGDIVGRSGRDAVKQYLPQLKQDLGVDFTIINAENAAHGFGISRSIISDLHQLGVDVVTSGNHVWDQKDFIPFVNQEKRFVRPVNYPKGTPGFGFTVQKTKSEGKNILVINAMGRLFMDPLDDPFQAIDDVLKIHQIGKNDLHAIVVDFHAEASSEKMAMGHYLDGRVTLVVGTHTHVPTGDAQILDAGTAYQTDAGMCGDYNSVIGMDKTVPILKFTRKMPTDRMQPATGPGTICGLLVDVNEKGFANSVRPIRKGPRLLESL
jgi:metallophosphoesterase (TIGR00282 family)